MASVLGVLRATGSGLVKAGEEVVHVVEVIGGAAVKVEKLLTAGSTLEPQVKAGIVQLIADGESVATAFVAAGSNPENFVADAAAVAEVEKLVKDFVAMLPVLKQAASALEAAVA